MSRLLCCWSVSTSVCDHARAHSGVEHTSALSTGTVRDPRDQPSSSPRSTSSRSPFITGFSCSSSSPGVLLLLSARGLTRDQSSLRVPSHPLRSLSASNFFSKLVGLLLTAIRESNLHGLDIGTQELFPCPLPVASLTSLQIRDTRSLLEVRLSLECSWSGACSEELSVTWFPRRDLPGDQPTPRSTQPAPHNLPCPWRDWRQGSRDHTSCSTRIPERCSSGPNGMTCFARCPTVSSTSSLLSLTSMWYIPLLMDPVSSTSSQKKPSIPRCTNVLTSSHRLLLSWSRVQPFNFAVGFHLRRQRQQPAVHQLGLVIQWVIDRELSLRSKPKGVPTAPSPSSTSGSPGSKLKSSSPRCARCLGSQDQRL